MDVQDRQDVQERQVGALQVFDYEENPVRTIDIDGEPWWVARDIAEALGYDWAGTATIKHIPEEWRGVVPIPTSRGERNTLIISEQGLYFFLGRSDKPAALPFQKWFANDVLPSIRKTGQYSIGQAAQIDVLMAHIEKYKEVVDVVLKMAGVNVDEPANRALQISLTNKVTHKVEQELGVDLSWLLIDETLFTPICSRPDEPELYTTADISHELGLESWKVFDMVLRAGLVERVPFESRNGLSKLLLSQKSIRLGYGLMRFNCDEDHPLILWTDVGKNAVRDVVLSHGYY
jgi:prophage antirepressor-like protein